MSFSHQLGYTYSLVTTSITTSPLLSPGVSTLAGSPGNVSTGDHTLHPLNSNSTPPSPPVPVTNQPVYNPTLLNYPRIGSGLTDTMNSLYTSAYAANGYVPFGSDPSAFYSPLTAGTNTDAWRNLSQGGAWPYDPTMAAYPYSTGYGGLDVRRKNATREATSTLKAWLYEHIKNPYPTKGEKIMLAIITKMTLTQVSTWFANARRRLKKENKMQWSPRNRTGDDDDDKDDSDADDVNNDDSSSHRKDDKDDDDEDIVVDGSIVNDRISSPDKNKDDSLLRDTSVGSLDISSLSGSSHEHSSVNPSSHNPHSYLGSSHTSGTKDLFGVSEHVQKDNSSHNKPRIWSMADMATASQPSQHHMERRSPVAIAHSLINKSGYTPFSSPSTQTVPPVLNGSYTGLTSQGSSGGIPPYRLGGYLPGSSVHGMLPNFHRPSSMSTSAATPASCAVQRLGNSMLGNTLDGPRLTPGGTPCANLDDSATAFKPVVRRS